MITVTITTTITIEAKTNRTVAREATEEIAVAAKAGAGAGVEKRTEIAKEKGRAEVQKEEVAADPKATRGPGKRTGTEIGAGARTGAEKKIGTNTPRPTEANRTKVEDPQPRTTKMAVVTLLRGPGTNQTPGRRLLPLPPHRRSKENTRCHPPPQSMPLFTSVARFPRRSLSCLCSNSSSNHWPSSLSICLSTSRPPSCSSINSSRTSCKRRCSRPTNRSRCRFIRCTRLQSDS